MQSTDESWGTTSQSALPRRSTKSLQTGIHAAIHRIPRVRRWNTASGMYLHWYWAIGVCSPTFSHSTQLENVCIDLFSSNRFWSTFRLSGSLGIVFMHAFYTAYLVPRRDSAPSMIQLVLRIPPPPAVGLTSEVIVHVGMACTHRLAASDCVLSCFGMNYWCFCFWSVDRSATLLNTFSH